MFLSRRNLNMEINNELISAIEALKIKIKISNRKLADFLGITGQTIGAWLSGRQTRISDKSYVKLINLLIENNIDIDSVVRINNSEKIGYEILKRCNELDITLQSLGDSIPYYYEKSKALGSSDFDIDRKESFSSIELSQLIVYLGIEHDKLNLSSFELTQLKLKEASKNLSYKEVELISLNTKEVIDTSYPFLSRHRHITLLKNDTESELEFDKYKVSKGSLIALVPVEQGINAIDEVGSIYIDLRDTSFYKIDHIEENGQDYYPLLNLSTSHSSQYLDLDQPFRVVQIISNL